MTGVQTCALPISLEEEESEEKRGWVEGGFFESPVVKGYLRGGPSPAHFHVKIPGTLASPSLAV